ncbi:hypothetical protein ACFL7D_08375 [candidate division KSB1 bacterium]
MIIKKDDNKKVLINMQNKPDKADQRKKLFIEYLSDPDNGDSLDDFAKKNGICPDDLNIWKNDPHVVNSAFRLCVTRMGAEIPKVMKMLLEKALKKDDTAATKLFFQQLEKFKETPEPGITVEEAVKLIRNELGKQNGK